jgi:hypothetical protein
MQQWLLVTVLSMQQWLLLEGLTRHSSGCGRQG